MWGAGQRQRETSLGCGASPQKWGVSPACAQVLRETHMLKEVSVLTCPQPTLSLQQSLGSTRATPACLGVSVIGPQLSPYWKDSNLGLLCVFSSVKDRKFKVYSLL